MHKTLFSFARKQMEGFLERHGQDAEVRADSDCLLNQYRLDRAKTPELSSWPDDPENAALASVVRYANWLMDRDSKITPLKSLQGRIWREGYASGDLKSEIFPDVYPAFVRWREQQKLISIFSSGSVLAQQLLFANTKSGDLSGFIYSYFDTTTGPKRDPESYGKIADTVGLLPANILFVSDTVKELDAARNAGMETALCVRQGALPAMSHKVIRTFDELVFRAANEG